MLQTGLVVFLERWGVNFDALGLDDGANLWTLLSAFAWRV